MERRTKIVATISDRKCDVEFIKQLYDAGMNVVRLNTAHQSPEDTLKVIKNVRAVSETLPVLVDTKGPELRTTALDESFPIKSGETIKVKGSTSEKSSKECLFVNYENFANEVPVGNCILIDDGELELLVVESKDGFLICKATNNGEIKGNKSVNIPGIDINLPALSAKDRKYIDFAIEHDIDFIAHSFVRSKEDVIEIQELLDKKNSKVKIIAKIESQTGVDNIDEILDHAYGVMVARGDLGIEIAAEKLPTIQINIIQKCVAKKKPVIIATQMLHSMISSPRPTRAEISDIASAVYRGTDAIMLSGETAYGDYPIEAVQTMNKVAAEVEASTEISRRKYVLPVDLEQKIAIFLAKSAIKASQRLPTKAVVLDTLSGQTARYVSAYRGQNIVCAVCYDKRVARELALSYGIFAKCLEFQGSTEEFRRKAVEEASITHNLLPDDLIIVIGGNFGPHQGATFLEIKSVKAFTGLKR